LDELVFILPSGAFRLLWRLPERPGGLHCWWHNGNNGNKRQQTQTKARTGTAMDGETLPNGNAQTSSRTAVHDHVSKRTASSSSRVKRASIHKRTVGRPSSALLFWAALIFCPKEKSRQLEGDRRVAV